jgi:acetyltransferase-like isoleucine patch superfamily enzyme
MSKPAKKDCIMVDSGALAPVGKKRLSKAGRVLRGIGAILDPRAYAHLLRIMNYYNYSHVRPRRLLSLGRDVALSPNVVFANAARISIGSGSNIGARCTLWAGPSVGRIIIGEHALLGPDVLLTAANYRFNDGSPVTAQPMDEADVVIGRDVWLGAKVVVLPGVTIGDGTIIGAGSVVTKSIGPGLVAVGVPARVVGERTAG